MRHQNLDNKIPIDAIKIFNQLQKAGYSVYFVGGCVRDSLMGITPKDWDLTTNATPDEVKAVLLGLCDIYPTGEKYGTLTARLNGNSYEITTFRADGNYSDGRRPDRVTFSKDIESDLARRDFTINAIAYSLDGQYVDPFKGITDLHAGVLRTVGNSDDRFREDALRIMRLFRFAAKFKFGIILSTLDSATRHIELLNNISMERKFSELMEIIVNTDNTNNWQLNRLLPTLIPELKECMGHTQNKYHCGDVYEHSISAMCADKTKSPIIRLALLLHDVGKPWTMSWGDDGEKHFYNHHNVSADMAVKILKRFKCSNKIINTVETLIRMHQRDIAVKAASIRRIVNKIGDQLFEALLSVMEADAVAHVPDFAVQKVEKLNKVKELYLKMREDESIPSLKTLAIDGYDVLALGIKGRKVGQVLQCCLEWVLEDPANSSRDKLLNYAKELIKLLDK